MRERMADRDKARLNALHQSAVDRLSPANQPHTKAKRLGLSDITGKDITNSDRFDRVKIEARAERQRSQNRQLVRGIDPVDIKRRVSFGIAKRLRIGEHRAKIARFGFHRGQDVIAGAVENAVDLYDLVGRCTFAKPFDHGNSTCNRSFIFECSACTLCSLSQFKPMVSDHRLIGSDESAAVRDCAACKDERRAVAAADEFDDNIDIVACRQLRCVIDPIKTRQINPAITAAITR